MGLVRTQKKGEGMIFEREDGNVNITILEIGGVEYNRVVRFKVEGIKGLSELELSADQGFFNLGDDIKIEVGNGMDKREDFVTINYDASEDYKLQRREFHDTRKVVKSEKIKNINSPPGFIYRINGRNLHRKLLTKN